MKIGIIGAGFIGRAIAKLAVASGHEVMISNSRDPMTLASAAVALKCATGTAAQAARFGDAVVVSVPFHAIESLDAVALAGKVVLDTCNYYPQRDGVIPSLDNMAETTGERLARHLGASHVVKAFNAILQGDLETDPRPRGDPERRALPIASDDPKARALAARLIDELGFDVVDAGPLSESWRFERGTPVYCVSLDKAKLVEGLAAATRGERVEEGSWRKRRQPATTRDHSHQMTGFSGRGVHDIVDAQVHLGLSPDINGALAAMDALGIRTMVVDEFWDFDNGKRPRPSAVLPNGAARPLAFVGPLAASLHPERFAFIQRVSREDQRVGNWISMLKETPGCVGLRVVLSSRDERRHFVDGDWDEVMRAAIENDLPLDLLTAEMPVLARTACERFPDLRLIAGHCGWAGSREEWDQALALADLPKVTLKWSHAHRTFRHFDDPDAAKREGLAAAARAFGAGRVMWASDISAEETRSSWSELLDFVRGHPGIADDDRSFVLGGTARRVYGLNGVQ